MVRLRVIVEPKSPLVLGSGMDSAQNVRESRDYIAGSVVRGVLAQAILERLGEHKTSRRALGGAVDASLRATFDALFAGASAVRFGYLYPTYLQGDGTASDAFAHESFPAPITLLACKAHRTDHHVLDALRGALRNELPPPFCRDCEQVGSEGRIERWRGYVLRRHDGTYDYRPGAPRRPLVRVGLNRWTEAAEEQILYVLEAIMPSAETNKPLAFVGFWTMIEQQWTQLKRLLDQFFPRDRNGYRLRLGSARARGLGEVRLWWHESPPPDDDDLAGRLDRFQDGLPDTDKFLYFSLTARSPLLVYDDTGSPARTLSPDVLRGYLSTVPKDLEPVEDATFIERETLTGWSQAWGLPKPLTSAIAAGSVFTYRVPKTERDAVLAFLKEIEDNGLGERRSEGFGDLAACDPFHVDCDASTVGAVS